MACIQLDPKVAPNRGDMGPRNFDFIPFSQPSQDIANNAHTTEAKARDDLRRVVRRRAMHSYLREKRHNNNKQKQLTQPKNPRLVTQRHSINIIPWGNSVDPFDTAPIKLEAYMYDLLQFCEYPLYSHSSTGNVSLMGFLSRLNLCL